MTSIESPDWRTTSHAHLYGDSLLNFADAYVWERVGLNAFLSCGQPYLRFPGNQPPR